MSERKRRPAYLLVILAAVVSSLLTYGTYRSFVERTISTPTGEAAERTVNALDPNGEGSSDRKPELPVWPPPSQSAPADPASNPMVGALPMRIDWPDAAEAHPTHSAH